MHSSMMHTVRSSSRLPAGGCLPEVLVCLGGYLPGGCLPGRCMPGGVCPAKCLLGLRRANISAFGIHKSFSVILCQVSDCTEVVPQELQLQSRIPEPLDSPKHPEFV